MLTRFGLFVFLAPLLAAQSGGIVEGTVVDSVAGKGIPGVTVELSSMGSKSAAGSAITDANGAFRVAGLAPGEYVAEFAKPGFRGSISRVLTGGSSHTIHIASDGDTQRISTTLIQLGGVGGRVLDSDGRGVPRLRVQCISASMTSNMVLLNSTTTDRDGYYHFGDLAPGAYLIEARPIERPKRGAFGATPAKKEEAPPLQPSASPEGERWVWVNTFYPGVTERSQAGRVALHAGWDLPGYDIRLQALATHRVSGVVFDADGKPAARVPVTIELSDLWKDDTDGATSREDGTFEFPAVHQGEWRLTGIRQPGVGALKGSAEVLVARHDVENVVLRMSPPFSISGTVEWEHSGDTKAESPIGRVTLQSVTRNASVTDGASADGTFRIDNVYPDRYEIQLWQVAGGYFAASILLGEREVMGHVVELAGSGSRLRVIAKAATGRVHGKVDEGAGATVVLLPKDETRLNNQYIRSMKCDADGRYEFGKVRPGEYYAWAFRGADMFALESVDFVRPLIGQAVSVQVDNGLVAAVDLK